MSKGVAGGRKNRGLYDGRNVSGARMWLEVGETEDSIVDAIRSKVWLEVGETKGCMVDAMYKEQGCGWR